MKNGKLAGLTLSAMISLLASPLSFAADKPESQAKSNKTSQRREMTQEERKEMAKMHQKMADCLNSKKSIQECRNEMRGSMRAMHDHGYCDHCGMMGGMMGHDHDDDDDHCD